MALQTKELSRNSCGVKNLEVPTKSRQKPITKHIRYVQSMLASNWVRTLLLCRVCTTQTTKGRHKQTSQHPKSPSSSIRSMMCTANGVCQPSRRGKKSEVCKPQKCRGRAMRVNMMFYSPFIQRLVPMISSHQISNLQVPNPNLIKTNPNREEITMQVTKATRWVLKMWPSLTLPSLRSASGSDLRKGIPW